MKIYVQFSDDTESTITTYFCCEQSKEAFPFLGEVELSDPRWIAFYESMPYFIQQDLPTPVYP